MTEQPGEDEPGALRLPRTPSGRFARRRLTPHRIPARPAAADPAQDSRAPGAAGQPSAARPESAARGGARGNAP